MCRGHCGPGPLFPAPDVLEQASSKRPEKNPNAEKRGSRASSEWIIHANASQHHRLQSNNQAIDLRLALFGRKRLSVPAGAAASVDILRVENETDLSRTEMCQVSRQEKATRVRHSLAHAVFALLLVSSKCLERVAGRSLPPTD